MWRFAQQDKIVRGEANTEAASEQIPHGRETRRKKKQSATGDQQSAKQKKKTPARVPVPHKTKNVFFTLDTGRCRHKTG
jgi:hypothetical protein